MAAKKRKIERCSTSMVVQSAMFDRSKWTRMKARQWLKDNGYKDSNVDSGKTKLKYEQQNPKDSCKGVFRLIEFGKGIKAILCCHR